MHLQINRIDRHMRHTYAYMTPSDTPEPAQKPVSSPSRRSVLVINSLQSLEDVLAVRDKRKSQKRHL